MPECRECGGFVTADYARVLEPEAIAESGEVRACPNCVMIRDGAEIRRASSRGNGQVGPTAPQVDGE